MKYLIVAIVLYGQVCFAETVQEFVDSFDTAKETAPVESESEYRERLVNEVISVSKENSRLEYCADKQARGLIHTDRECAYLLYDKTRLDATGVTEYRKRMEQK